MNTNEVLRIAVQKSGRLHDGSVQLLRESGLEISNGRDQLRLRVGNFPVELLFLRDDDIPEYVADKVADAGIVGENLVSEKGLQAEIVQRLDFARCRLSIAVPKIENYTGLSWLNGKSIATSYPTTTAAFLTRHGIDASIHEISGSVEIAPGIGLADAICDLVSSGSTLLSNGLREVETVLKSEAVLIANNSLSKEKETILQQLTFRFSAVRSARNKKYILMNVPDGAIESITRLVPGMNSPTIMSLNRAGWFSLHAVVEENDFWEKIDRLKSFGAEGILVLPIEKMIP
ncbi:MAG: ATP phosphoribosyltransferase [Bacteroidetes bacterium]|nr:ATP phosphoribosyltransferase [Bacteroidota bacterium]